MSAMGSKGLPDLHKGIGSRISQFRDSTLGWISLVYCTKELTVVHKSFTLVFKQPGKYLFASFWCACILYCKYDQHGLRSKVTRGEKKNVFWILVLVIFPLIDTLLFS